MSEHGRHLLALTDRLNGTETYDQAADLVEEILDPVEGALERLADFFEATGEKAKESDADDGFDLAQDFEEAAVDIRRLNEDLHLAVDRMRALTTSPPRTLRPGHALVGHRCADACAADERIRPTPLEADAERAHRTRGVPQNRRRSPWPSTSTRPATCTWS
ncbi:hypothetical protein [Streptomyces niveus]|uniref:hypothetical protein n=1 Tax=Streptomyces niveus TaxID=193462 RepID=UPI0036ACD894